MFTKDQIEVLSRSSNDFVYFTEHIFSKSVPNFVSGEYLRNACRFLANDSKSIYLAFRSGMKSYLIYAYIMWKILFEGSVKDLDILYFSFKEDLAAMHIRNIKRLISNNPYYDESIDFKSQADGIGEYTWDRKHVVSIRPFGIISATRGLKGDILIADDILSDPRNPIHPNVILKVNELFHGVILKDIKPGGEIHVVGSPISRVDFYFEPGLREEFAFKSIPAILDRKTEKERSAWPELFSLQSLNKDETSMGTKKFASEMMMSPYYSEDSFFTKDYLMKKVVNPNFVNLKINAPYKTSNNVIAGFDVGKAKHPSLLVVLEQKNNKFKMIHYKFMRGWKYFSGKDFWHFLQPTQLEYIKQAIKNFNIDKVYFDATRAEFEGAHGIGLWPPEFVPVVITMKLKNEMAQSLDKAVLNREIEIINSDELLNSITAVTNELIAIEDQWGHGEGFSSLCLAMLGIQPLLPSSNLQDKALRVGSRSIFEDKQPIPLGF